MQGLIAQIAAALDGGFDQIITAGVVSIDKPQNRPVDVIGHLQTGAGFRVMVKDAVCDGGGEHPRERFLDSLFHGLAFAVNGYMIGNNDNRGKGVGIELVDQVTQVFAQNMWIEP